MIAKPTIDLLGLCVEKLYTLYELSAYWSYGKVDFMVQEFTSYEDELGIFYDRYPGETKGNISVIPEKKILIVTSDGSSTAEQLLQLDHRDILKLSILKQSHTAL